MHAWTWLKYHLGGFGIFWMIVVGVPGPIYFLLRWHTWSSAFYAALLFLICLALGVTGQQKERRLDEQRAKREKARELIHELLHENRISPGEWSDLDDGLEDPPPS